LGDESLHGARQAEAQHERPEGLPEHEEPLAEAVEDVCHERTRRAMAAEASATLASASGPPEATASRTQWARWPSRSSKATDSSALVAAETWVSTSMQYVSSSTMRCKPRT